MKRGTTALSIGGETAPKRPIAPLGPSPIALPKPTVLDRPAAIITLGLVAWSIVIVINVAHGLHLHAPRPGLMLKAPWIIQLHVAAAVGALVIGTALLVGVKGRAFHKAAGWTWVVCMMTVAIGSFWIRTTGHLSYIHVLSGGVDILVPVAIAAVKRGDLKAHRRGMTRTFLGGLIIAGAFTFVPGRLMWMIFLG
jgi:uncharacterized membrane protein